MASSYKTSKAELVAIYRLEFYKKQKCWKYFSQERKKEDEKRRAARKANSKAKLNQTYNIEPAPQQDTDPVNTEAEELKDLKLGEIEETDEALQKEVDVEEELATLPSEDKGDDLNEAFVDTETDDTATLPAQLDPPNSPYSPKWSIQQWAAQCRPLWNQESTCPTQVYPTESNQLNPKYEADLQCYGADVPRFCPDLPQYGASVDAKTSLWEQFRYEGCEEGWPARSQVWTNRQEWFEGLSDIPAEASSAPEMTAGLGAAGAAGDAVDGSEWALLGRAHRWLGTSDQSETGYCDSLASVSSGSFSRGAALAIHSTEIDLRIPDSSEEMAAGLSAEALAAAVARHAGALQALLGEAKRRDQGTASTSPVDQLFSFDEYPARDVGPSRPGTAVSDVIVAGSFRNRPDLRGHTDPGLGRGRGKRLYKSGIIGIGRGRPYRL